MLRRFTGRVPKLIVGTAAAAAIALSVGVPAAFAHVGTDKDEIVAGESSTLSFSIGHGCEDEATNSMNGLAVAGIIVGGLGLATGGTALALGRQKSN